ncbi:hypothetical protein Poli38472_007034 [Pythium oligandrum]|uniref:Uncharacterized protein n=1 Tax=Pythium oligandrum TaxID=41045 RepID=A0A8K1FFD8_PYTOL|nr:hypothetical protein Poli38472_007034 [Pythium oligandrum]|eukprot:TMW58889.1 hypothetical protein Poli38472_007034 [Pythium oligandrum]
MEHADVAYHQINETSVLQGNATGDGHVFGLPLAWVETNRGQSLLIALACSWIASMVSVYNIYQHLQHYSRPQLQRYIVRILVIVPVYALGSFLSLKFVNQALYFDTLRDIYEAFVVYSFLALVLSFAGGESVCVLKMQGEQDITHAFPLNRCLHPIARDGRLLRSCKRAAIQFVLIKPFFAILSLIMLICGQYNTLAYQLILTVVYNISYSVALYGLWLFYFATKHILKSFNPVLKFFAVKCVIFLTFWQNSMIDFVPGITNEQSFAWKDFVMCVEMVPFAIVHFLAFNPNQFKKNLDRLPDSEVLKNMKEVLSLADIFADAYHNFMPSYQDYMLQRADSTGRPRRGKSVVVFGDDGLITNSPVGESHPTPVGISSAHVPKFVIDDEDDDDEEEEEVSGVRMDNKLRTTAGSVDSIDLEAGTLPSTTSPAESVEPKDSTSDNAEQSTDATSSTSPTSSAKTSPTDGGRRRSIIAVLQEFRRSSTETKEADRLRATTPTPSDIL